MSSRTRVIIECWSQVDRFKFRRSSQIIPPDLQIAASACHSTSSKVVMRLPVKVAVFVVASVFLLVFLLREPNRPTYKPVPLPTSTNRDTTNKEKDPNKQENAVTQPATNDASSDPLDFPEVPSGPPSVAALMSLMKDARWKAMETYSDMFLVKNVEIYNQYGQLWVKDPFHCT
jgi:hypothetical protein